MSARPEDNGTLARPRQDDDIGAPAQPLGLGWTAALEPRARGAVLRVAHPEQGQVAIEITITARGPVIRATAAALELESATDIHARCDRFTVEARESVTLRAPAITQQAAGTLRAEGRAIELEARAGDVRIHANDDVQVMGEQVLLNCERETPPPGWLPQLPAGDVTVERADVSGDVTLFDDPAPRD